MQQSHGALGAVKPFSTATDQLLAVLGMALNPLHTAGFAGTWLQKSSAIPPSSPQTYRCLLLLLSLYYFHQFLLYYSFYFTSSSDSALWTVFTMSWSPAIDPKRIKPGGERHLQGRGTFWRGQRTIRRQKITQSIAASILPNRQKEQSQTSVFSRLLLRETNPSGQQN